MKGKIKMATTKIWKVVKRLDHVMDYATNSDKTENQYYTCSSSLHILI